MGMLDPPQRAGIAKPLLEVKYKYENKESVFLIP